MKRSGNPVRSRNRVWSVGQADFTLYGPGTKGAEVVLVTIGDGGHTWPGGDVATQAEGDIVGPVNRGISASELMWEFFARHPKETK